LKSTQEPVFYKSFQAKNNNNNNMKTSVKIVVNLGADQRYIRDILAA